jgi:sugar lactone lactonase YvrE
MRALALFLAVGVLSTTGAAHAQYKAWVLSKFDDTPEGLTVDKDGNYYTSLIHTGKIMKVKPDGQQELIATIPSDSNTSPGATVGVELDNKGNLYVAYKQDSPMYEASNLVDQFHAACRDVKVTASGVYKIELATKKVTALATKADGWPFCFPDDVDIDDQGNVYMTDLTYAGIWKISPDGKKVDLWSADPLLNWSPQPYSGVPLGVNDLAIAPDGKSIYAVTDGDPMLVKVPIAPDGTAGKATVVARGYSPFDGIAFDDKGNIYVSEILRSELWVLSPDGSKRALVANKKMAPLDDNTSLAWYKGTICTANLGFTHQKPEQADKTIVCIRGYDMP